MIRFERADKEPITLAYGGLVVARDETGRAIATLPANCPGNDWCEWQIIPHDSLTGESRARTLQGLLALAYSASREAARYLA